MIRKKWEWNNLTLFDAKAPPLIGLDIGASAVKLLELESTGPGSYRLERYVIEDLSKDAVVDGNIMNLDVVVETTKRAWKKLGSRIKNVAIALPSSMVITKRIFLPAGLREADLEIQVEAEAAQYIPFPLDEVNLDFCVLGPSNGREDVEVLIAAAKKDKVEDRVAVVDAAGLNALVLDVDLFATFRAFDLAVGHLPAHGRDQNIALVDIGAQMMHFYVLRNGQSIFAREQPFGGNQLTLEIQRTYNLSYDEAEKAKKQGGLPEGYEGEILQPFIETLAQEVARALQFFFTSTSYNRVDHIVLCGGNALIPSVSEIVSKRTNINSTIGNPFVEMPLSAKLRPHQATADAPRLVVSCGLALRRFD